MSPDSNVLRQLAIDWRLVLMGLVLVATATVFNILSGGLFLSPENLYNIAQQTAVVGIVATVVVLVIVVRHRRRSQLQWVVCSRRLRSRQGRVVRQFCHP